MGTIAYLNIAARMYLRTARERAAVAAIRLQENNPASAKLWLDMAQESLSAGLGAASDPSRAFPYFRNDRNFFTTSAGGAA